MILYFSGTGNTAFIANEIARRIDDEAINLLNRIKNSDYSEIHSEKPFIICLPVYVCTIPTFLIKYLKKLKLSGNKNVYFIFTSGGYAGMSVTKGRSIARKHHMKFLGRAEFQMPRNYLVSGHYPPNTDEEIKERIEKSFKKLDSVVETIKNGGKLKERYVWLLEKIIIVPFVPVWSKIKFKTKDFYVNDKCIGCGKCEKVCPLNCIKIENKIPVWMNAHCAHCVSCLQNCPVEAIEFKYKTEGKPRYSIKRYKNITDDLTNNK